MLIKNIKTNICAVKGLRHVLLCYCCTCRSHNRPVIKSEKITPAVENMCLLNQQQKNGCCQFPLVMIHLEGIMTEIDITKLYTRRGTATDNETYISSNYIYRRVGLAMQRQTAVTAYLKNKQLLLFVFAGLRGNVSSIINAIIGSHICVIGRSGSRGGGCPFWNLDNLILCRPNHYYIVDVDASYFSHLLFFRYLEMV